MDTFRVIMAERKRREMDPTIALLEHCVVEAKSGGPSEDYTRVQLEKMLEVVRMVTSWYGQIDKLSPSALERLFRNGAKLVSIFGWMQPGAKRPAADAGPVAETEDIERFVISVGYDPVGRLLLVFRWGRGHWLCLREP